MIGYEAGAGIRIGSDLLHPDDVGRVAAFLAALRDEPGRVSWIEARVRALGLRVAIDDFGTGYSSLAYLRRFPVDVLKLDRSFVEAMDAVEADAAIVQAVVTMGHVLGMRITAEGVERAEQAVQLRALGCDAAQGFYYAPALPPAEAEELLRTEHGVAVDDGRVVPIRRRVNDAS